MGKTRLLTALHAALPEDLVRAYVDLGSSVAAEEGDVVEAIGRVLDLGPDGPDPLGSLAVAIGARRLLLVVDEAERSASAVATAVALLVARCPALVVVAASRTALPIAGATTVPVEPLPTAEAAELLIDRLQDGAPDLDLRDDLPRAGRLVDRVDCLPLALELLAGYARAHSVEDLESLLETPLDLATGEAGRPERHRSLRETVLWSVDRLPAGHREVLRRLGVFAGSFDLAAATAVVGPAFSEVAETTRSLARDGLDQVQRAPEGLRFRLLTTVRDLALDGLREHDEHAAAAARHRRWYADRWRGSLRSDRLLQDVRDHQADYLAALRSAVDQRDASTLGALTITLGRLWIFGDRLTTGSAWFAAALDLDVMPPVDAAKVRV
ncbi:ATP-binding protein, partial [Sphingomonas sp. PB1R3]|uniref:ATP-binding protein n=1 Tax=Sphingomonas flavida TaxID=3096154 RepID=UPI002FC7E81E